MTTHARRIPQSRQGILTQSVICIASQGDWVPTDASFYDVSIAHFNSNFVRALRDLDEPLDAHHVHVRTHKICE